MQPLQQLIELTRWTSANYIHNLGYLPPDRLFWQPWPGAASAGEITVHVCAVMHGMQQAFQSGIYEYEASPEWKPFASIGEAQQLMGQVSQEYACFLESLCPLDLQGHVLLEAQQIARVRGVLMPVLDLIHHHGQLAYIQTLLGDTQTHFFEVGT